MKTIVIDLDNLADFIIFANAIGTSFVDVQGLTNDTLFLIPGNTNFPVMIQHSCPSGSWKKTMPANIQVFEATVESM